MAKRETDDEYYKRTGKLRDGDWGGPEETRPGFGETLSAEAQRALEEKIANGLIGERKKKGESQAEFEARRDAADAGNASTAFSAILTAAMTPLLLMSTPGWVPGPQSAVSAIWVGMVTSAGIAVRVAFAKLSEQDKAKIWRGEV